MSPLLNRKNKSNRRAERVRLGLERLGGRVVPAVFTWTGTTGTAWANEGNWALENDQTPGNDGVPGTSDTAYFAGTVTNQPVIASNAPAQTVGMLMTDATWAGVITVNGILTTKGSDLSGAGALQGTGTLNAIDWWHNWNGDRVEVTTISITDGGTVVLVGSPQLGPTSNDGTVTIGGGELWVSGSHLLASDIVVNTGGKLANGHPVVPNDGFLTNVGFLDAANTLLKTITNQGGRVDAYAARHCTCRESAFTRRPARLRSMKAAPSPSETIAATVTAALRTRTTWTSQAGKSICTTTPR